MNKYLIPLFLLTGLLTGCEYTDKVKNSVTSMFNKSVEGQEGATLDVKKYYTPSPLQMDEELQKQINQNLQKQMSTEELKKVENVDFQKIKFINLGDYIKKRISQEGLVIEWRLKGEYYTDESSLPTFEQIGLGMFLNSINMNMYNQNINRYISFKMNSQNKTEYPHPLLVFFALCGNKIVAVEKDTLNEFNIAMREGELSGCSQVPQNFKLKVSSSLPPFAQAYDPNAQNVDKSIEQKIKNNPNYQKAMQGMLTPEQKKKLDELFAQEGIKAP